MTTKLIYTTHALDRMHKRIISKTEVEECLNHYDTSYTDKCGNPICLATLASGRRIKAVLKKENTSVVITVADK